MQQPHFFTLFEDHPEFFAKYHISNEKDGEKSRNLAHH
jgi:hypothetical protein